MTNLSLFDKSNTLIAPFMLQGRMIDANIWSKDLEPIANTLFCLGDVQTDYSDTNRCW